MKRRYRRNRSAYLDKVLAYDAPPIEASQSLLSESMTRWLFQTILSRA